jgi:asparagine synthase (glutamine-hydrolysing)
MCGIAGIITNNEGIISDALMRSAAKCLRHRGPEGQTVWIAQDNKAALAHARLSIIDLSPAAAQPMRYADRYVIVHNGEIYNYIEIRQDLEQKGITFSTRSDTEVIAAAYQAWGQDCLQRFDGMFAFAIWDEEEKRLFAARDRFGEKPFFFFYDEGRLVFASELKALWELGIKKEVNPAMLYNFLTIGYTGNPSDPEESFYTGVHQLPAASFLSYQPGSGQPELTRYWQIYPEVDHRIDPETAVETFRHLLGASVGKRLRSDVAIGTSLSGGLDSSAVVAFCERESSDRYSHKCFTASFGSFEKNELEFARKVAEQFHLEHHIVEIDGSKTVQLMDEVMRHQEEPFGSASVLAQYEVFRTARQNGVTVLLDGQGADEVLAGYHRYYKWYWRELYRKKMLAASGEVKAARELGVDEGFSFKDKAAALLPEFSAAIVQGRKATEAFRQAGLDRDFAFANKKNLYYSTPTAFDLNGVLYFNSFVSGLGELLRLADRNSMAHATELRLPFLNHELVAFLFTLPAQLKIRSGWTKWILRQSVKDDLPPEITWRRDKIGFEPPQKKWMENKTVQEAIMAGKKKLVDHGILSPLTLQKAEPHTAYAARGFDWKYWSASYLFD